MASTLDVPHTYIPYSGGCEARTALLGGGLIGCETAEYLASQGRRVVIYEMLDGLAKTLNMSRRRFTLERMTPARATRGRWTSMSPR